MLDNFPILQDAIFVINSPSEISTDASGDDIAKEGLSPIDMT